MGNFTLHRPLQLLPLRSNGASWTRGERLERILPWLVRNYENTWYFAVEHEAQVRARAKRDALSPAHQERLFISHYDEGHQRWQTDLRQAAPRSTPVEPDQERSEPEPPRIEQPAVSEAHRRSQTSGCRQMATNLAQSVYRCSPARSRLLSMALPA